MSTTPTTSVSNLGNFQLLNEKQAAQVLCLSEKTLQAWRFYGKGPAYRKIGRAIRYDLRDLEKYVEQRTVNPAEGGAQ